MRLPVDILTTAAGPPLRFVVVSVVAFLLAACTITSDKPLVAASEGAAPLPEAFTVFLYRHTPDGYVRGTDEPVDFTQQGNAYVTDGVPGIPGTLAIRFIPVGDEAFIVAATVSTNQAMTYGFARYADGVIAVAFSPDTATAAALRRDDNRVMPQQRKALADLAVSPHTSAIVVRHRRAINYLAHLYFSGRLPMALPLVGYVEPDADTMPPARLVPSGKDWIVVP